MALEQLLGTDKVSPTGKNKINNIVTKLLGGYPGQALISQGDGSTDPQWEDLPLAQIPGGNEGDILTKNSSLDADFDWSSPNVPFATLTLTGGASSGADLGYRLDIGGKIELKGSFLSTYNNANVLFTLPSGYRPPRTVRYACAIGDAPNSYVGWISINASGEGRVIAPANITTGDLNVNLDGITFYP